MHKKYSWNCSWAPARNTTPDASSYFFFLTRGCAQTWGVDTIPTKRVHWKARHWFSPREQELSACLEPAEPRDIFTNRRRKDQERGSGLAKTCRKKLIWLHVAFIQVLSSRGMIRCGVQRLLHRWAFLPSTSRLEEGSSWAVLLGSDQAASLRDRFLHPNLLENHRERAAGGEKPSPNAVRVTTDMSQK